MAETGFCKKCGAPVEVAVLPQDRLQSLAARMAQVQWTALRSAETQGDVLARAIVGLWEAAGWLIDDLAGSVPVEVTAGVDETVMLAEAALDQDWHSQASAALVDELREGLIEAQIRLALAAEALAGLSGEETDLLRLAVERLGNGYE